MDKIDFINYLKKIEVNERFIDKIIDFRGEDGILDNDAKQRLVSKPKVFYGREVINKAIAGILSGHHILLSGPKATGKNLLAENLAYIFNRPIWNVSINVGTDASSLIGEDTFVDNQVILKKGPVIRGAQMGGFVILDEINMAKNEAISVLHSALDYRREIDVPGYDLFKLRDETRFIATMNYGYSGTRELNEALASRFLIIDVPIISNENLEKVIEDDFSLEADVRISFVKLFKDLEMKALNSEISSKSVDLRGLLSSLKAIEVGLDLYSALEMGILDKSFDSYEKEIINDVIKINFPQNLSAEEVFRRGN